MAEEGAKLISGYVQSMFLEQPVQSKFLCGYGKPEEHVMRDPVQSSCGHRFCRSCIELIASSSSSSERAVGCPACLAEEQRNGVDISDATKLEADSLENCGNFAIKQLFPDNAVRKEIQALRVRCVHNGCPWTDQPLKEFDAHDKICPKRPLQCPTCSLWFPGDEFPQHKKAHKSTQERQCPFSCGLLVADCKMDEHLSEHQDKHLLVLHTRLTHIYETLGLNATLTSTSAVTLPQSSTVSRENIISRLCAVEQNLHTLQTKDVLARSTSQIMSTSESLETRRSTASPTIGRTVSDGASFAPAGPSARDIETRLARVEEQMSMFQQVSVVLNKEIKGLYNNVDVLEHQCLEQDRQIKLSARRLEELEKQAAGKDGRIADLEQKILSLEQTSYDGTLVWKISEFSRRRNEATSGRTPSFYSPPFYTSKTGYKLCARIYLNGDGMGKGTHVSVFFVVMRGQYDAVLKWPFQHKVILTFLNQNGVENTVDAFRPDPSSTSFKRPVTEMNVASGCPKFLALSELDSGRNAYVADDTAFVRITVDQDE